jgi:hypothetical protein
MDPYRKTAIIVGVLFITATVTAILTIVLLGSILEPPDYLTKVAENESQVIVAEILWLVLAVSVMGIGVMMFPVLKKYDEGLALGYAGIRLIEAVFIIAASLSLLPLLTLRQEYVAAALDATYYQPSGTLLLALSD